MSHCLVLGRSLYYVLCTGLPGEDAKDLGDFAISFRHAYWLDKVPDNRGVGIASSFVLYFGTFGKRGVCQSTSRSTCSLAPCRPRLC